MELQLATPGKVTLAGFQKLLMGLSQLKVLGNFSLDVSLESIMNLVSLTNSLEVLEFGLFRGNVQPWSEAEKKRIKMSGKKLYSVL